nr:hypothetical protein [uncultured bacterium]
MYAPGPRDPFKAADELGIVVVRRPDKAYRLRDAFGFCR